MKNFLLSDEKRFCSLVRRGRGFVFASAKNGNECDLKILSSSSSFLHLFSLTPIGVLFVCLFVRLFVCLFTRARGSMRKVFICITLQHLFWYTKNAVFATQFAHCFCTQFAHNLHAICALFLYPNLRSLLHQNVTLFRHKNAENKTQNGEIENTKTNHFQTRNKPFRTRNKSYSNEEQILFERESILGKK